MKYQAGLIIVVFLEVLKCSQAYVPMKYYMDSLCPSGQPLTISQPSIRLKLTRRSSYRSNMDCVLSLKASSSLRPTNRSATDSQMRLMVVFRKIDIATEFFQCNDYVTLRDGPSVSYNVVSGLSSKHCGENEPNGAYFTTGDTLTVRFVSNLFDNDDGFDLLITPFHTGQCTSSEMKCNRGQCISQQNKCNSYNNCGDYSDEGCTSLWRIGAGVIVGIIIPILVVIVIVAVVAYCICKRRGGFRGHVKRSGEDSHHNIPLNQQTYPPPQQNYPPPPQQGYPPQPGYPPQSGYPPQQGYPPAQPPPYDNNPYPYGKPQ